MYKYTFAYVILYILIYYPMCIHMYACVYATSPYDMSRSRAFCLKSRLVVLLATATPSAHQPTHRRTSRPTSHISVA